MKTIFLTTLLAFLSASLISQTPINGGDVSGVWTSAGSPYEILGEINVPLNEQLTIEKGVEVVFQGHYKFMVYGTLMANGNEGDSILFTAADQETGWHSLRFIDNATNSQDSSRLSYCIIEYGKSYGTCPDNSGAGIFAGHAHPVILYSHIRNNRAESGMADWGGGGIYFEYSNGRIIGNRITNNYSGHDGGGIYCAFSSPQIYGNEIDDNEAAYRGGGIACFSFSSPVIRNNVITNNSAYSRGGGIDLSGGNSLCIHNWIIGNESGEGGGVSCYLSDSRIINNLITDNMAQRGGGVCNRGSSPLIVNNTIANNEAVSKGGGLYNTMEFLGIQVYSHPVIINDIIYFNIAEEGRQIYSDEGNVPVISFSDIETLSSSGVQGAFNDVEGNIEEDPSFIQPISGQYALNPDSPCIDMGTQETGGLFLEPVDLTNMVRIWDGDNNGSAIIDMGAYEFGAPPAAMQDSESISKAFNLQVSPNPMIGLAQLSFELSRKAYVSVELFEVSGIKVKTIKSGQYPPGNQTFNFNFDKLESGLYLVRLSSGGISESIKVLKQNR